MAGGGDGRLTASTVFAGIRTALLANPLLDGDRLLVVRRDFGGRGRDGSRQLRRRLRGGQLPEPDQHARSGWDNEIAVLSDLRGKPRIETLYKPPATRFSATYVWTSPPTMLFSSIDDNGRWAVFEMRSDGSGRQLTPTDYPDLDFFDACYLPDGRIIVSSTANYFGLPCLDGKGQVASLYLLDPATNRCGS